MKIKKDTPILKQFSHLWTLTFQPNEKQEWSLEEKIRQAKKAGFDAIGGAALPDAAALAKKNGLEYVCYVDAHHGNYREQLEKAKATHPSRVTVQLCDHDTPPKKAIKVWLKMESLARKLGLEADLEVHRDTCTETPEKTYEIAHLFQKTTGRKLRFCWDFSHIAVVKHLYPPFAKRLIERPDLVCLARQFHFRPFNGHHCQIPATDGQGNLTLEMKDYLAFVDDLLTVWLKGTKGGEVLYTCPEFGPHQHSYGISILPNVWQDAIVTRFEIEKLWKKKLTEAGW